MEIHVITCPKGHCQAIDVINTTNDELQRRPCNGHRSQSLTAENALCALCEPNWAEGGPDNTCVGIAILCCFFLVPSPLVLNTSLWHLP
jgi:hypothetical protein